MILSEIFTWPQRGLKAAGQELRAVWDGFMGLPYKLARCRPVINMREFIARGLMGVSRRAAHLALYIALWVAPKTGPWSGPWASPHEKATPDKEGGPWASPHENTTPTEELTSNEGGNKRDEVSHEYEAGLTHDPKGNL